VNEASRREIIGVLKEGNREGSFGRIHTYVEESGGLDYASRRASEMSEKALESIVNIGQSVYYDSLVNIVRFAVARAS
jgi:geranylgeranyl pyrophosphate synthase